MQANRHDRGIVLTDPQKPVSANCPNCGAGKDKRKAQAVMGAVKPVEHCTCGHVFQEASNG